jgi:hypothetical protein
MASLACSLARFKNRHKLLCSNTFWYYIIIISFQFIRSGLSASPKLGFNLVPMKFGVSNWSQRVTVGPDRFQGEGIWPSVFFENFQKTFFQWTRLPTLILTLTLTPIYQLSPNPGGKSPPQSQTPFYQVQFEWGKKDTRSNAF